MNSAIFSTTLILLATMTLQAKSSLLQEEGTVDYSHGQHSKRAPDLDLADEVYDVMVECPSTYFFSSRDSACKPCSICPINQIIRKPCSTQTDTVCGPFFEFDKFHQASSLKNSLGLPENGHRRRNHHQGHDSESLGGSSDPGLSSVSVEEKEEDQWRVLAISLITVLSVVCILIVVFGILICNLRRRQLSEKQHRCEEELLPSFPTSEPRYVETSISSRDRLKSSYQTPIRDDVYESGSDVLDVMTSSLPQITAVVTEEDAHEIGQTIKPRSSSDYVYFNRPCDT